MSKNLPPGVTTADIDRHYGHSDHEHEWRPIEKLCPVLEDGAAIFHEECEWAEVVNSYTDHARDEVYYEYGQECGATRSYRFELAYVTELTADGKPDLRLDRDELDQQEEAVLDVVAGAERAFPEETEVVDIDPDPEHGQVVIRYDGYELGYGGER